MRDSNVLRNIELEIKSTIINYLFIELGWHFTYSIRKTEHMSGNFVKIFVFNLYFINNFVFFSCLHLIHTQSTLFAKRI